MTERFSKNSHNIKAESTDTVKSNEGPVSQNREALERIQRSLTTLCVGIDDEDNQIKLVYSKLQHLVSHLSDMSEYDSTLLNKVKLLVVTFLDLVRIDRMVLYGGRNKENIAEQTYGREDEDLSKIYTSGPRAEKKVLNQDELLAWFDGSKDEKLDIFFNQNNYSNEQSEPNPIHVHENASELVDEIIALLETIESNRYDRYYRRKANVALSSGNINLDQFKERHKAHYRHFFTNQEGVSPNEVVLTNSGSRANEAVLRALVKNGCSKVFIQEGWYYENIRTAKIYMDESPIDTADVFLLNADSSQPVNDEYYRSIFTKNLALITDRATKEPTKTFYLVVDATCNLLTLENWHIPDNVTLVKSYSATKHQRGGHNYFFGGAAVYGSDKLAKDIEETATKDGAGLDGLSALHYPRLRQTEIRQNTENIHKLNEALKERLAIAQSEVPPALRIQCHSYNYYTYLQFPTILNYEENLKRELEIFINNLFSSDTGKEFDYETGDSFGLDKTRLCNIGGKLFRCIRFSPGDTSDEEKITRLANYLGSTWSSLVTKSISDESTSKFGKTWHGSREEYLASSKIFVEKLESISNQLSGNPRDGSAIQAMEELLHPAGTGNFLAGGNGAEVLDDDYRTIGAAMLGLFFENSMRYFPSMTEPRNIRDEVYFKIETIKGVIQEILAIYDARKANIS